MSSDQLPDSFEKISKSLDAHIEGLVAKGAERGIYRRCALGCHLECEDWMGLDCKCPCHPILAQAIQDAHERGEIA